MARKIVLMVVIPGNVKRGNVHISDLSYLRYALPSWRWWCERNGVDFVLADRPVDGPMSEGPAPLQRWKIGSELLVKSAPGTQIAIVDADTMIRWDTPDFFALANGRLSVVPDVWDARWIYKSIQTYQMFFPGIDLPWWDYFNSGFIILNHGHVGILDYLVDLYLARKDEIDAIHRAVDVGIDQTLLNFSVKACGEVPNVLPRTFNYVGCFDVPPSMRRVLEKAADPNDLSTLESVGAFDFIQYSYVWHFTSVTARSRIMKASWDRVRHHYDGAQRFEAQDSNDAQGEALDTAVNLSGAG